MIYENVVMADIGSDEKDLTQIQKIVSSVVKDNEGEILIEENWGPRRLSQPTEKGLNRGHYLYTMFKSNGKSNTEINRRLGLNEKVINSSMVKIGDDRDQATILKDRQSPYPAKQ